MQRRTYLSLGIGALVGCTSTKSAPKIACAVSYQIDGEMQGTTTQVQVPDDAKTKAAVMGGAGGPNLPFNNYYSHLYWVGVDAFETVPETWLGAATVGPRSGQKGEIYLNEDAPFISDYVLYHERGHNLGYTHRDGGIMDYHAPDQINNEIADPTKAIATNSDGIEYLEWDSQTRARFRQLYRDGELSDTTAAYIFGRQNGQQDVWSTGEMADAVNKSGVDVSGGGFYTDTNDGWR